MISVVSMNSTVAFLLQDKLTSVFQERNSWITLRMCSHQDEIPLRDLCESSLLLMQKP